MSVDDLKPALAAKASTEGLEWAKVTTNMFTAFGLHSRD
jgi:hypothetical protein